MIKYFSTMSCIFWSFVALICFCSLVDDSQTRYLLLHQCILLPLLFGFRTILSLFQNTQTPQNSRHEPDGLRFVRRVVFPPQLMDYIPIEKHSIFLTDPVSESFRCVAWSTRQCLVFHPHHLPGTEVERSGRVSISERR